MSAKTSGYSNATRKAKLDTKREAAFARQAQWEKLTPSQQVASLRTRRGQSKRQIARIERAAK